MIWTSSHQSLRAFASAISPSPNQQEILARNDEIERKMLATKTAWALPLVFAGSLSKGRSIEVMKDSRMGSISNVCKQEQMPTTKEPPPILENTLLGAVATVLEFSCSCDDEGTWLMSALLFSEAAAAVADEYDREDADDDDDCGMG